MMRCGTYFCIIGLFFYSPGSFVKSRVSQSNVHASELPNMASGCSCCIDIESNGVWLLHSYFKEMYF